MKTINKKLYLSASDKKLAGVIGGISDYFEVDSTLLRIIFIVLLVLTGFFPFGLLYILAWIIMPKESDIQPVVVDDDTDQKQS